MDKELLEAGYRAYTGEKIDVYFNTAICQHSGNCVRGNGGKSDRYLPERRPALSS